MRARRAPWSLTSPMVGYRPSRSRTWRVFAADPDLLCPPMATQSDEWSTEMNQAQIKGQWKQVMGEAKRRWGRLADDDARIAEGDLEKLAGRIQEHYGDAKEAVREELTKLVASLAAAAGTEGAEAVPQDDLDDLAERVQDHYDDAEDAVQDELNKVVHSLAMHATSEAETAADAPRGATT